MTTNNIPKHVPLEHINDIDVISEMQDSFLEYAYSVIYSRALPDARDGLKPVQRRILYMMSTMGLTPDKGHVKSTRVIGEVMGKLHPHGDSAIYDALVRMSQDFMLRVPLIDGHGNFGSLDDGPAAARYTEARLAPPSLALVHDLDEDVVDFVPNYDNQFSQPEVLPAAFPNLLVNGASGIAVGMATNMAPHNLKEIIDAACHLLKHPEASSEDLMRHVPGPDLPSGGNIIKGEGIAQAYETGRGSFKMRAKVEIESVSARKTALVATELPYGVGPEKVIQKIKKSLGRKKLQGISDVTDLSGRDVGLRLVITLKSGFNPQAILEQLYQYTPLEESFSINNVALCDGKPQTLGLKALLRIYLDHRIQVIRRRSQYRLNRQRERLHLVDGLLLALVDIDKVIQIIRHSEDVKQARQEIIKTFKLSTVQADYILDLQLRRITRFSQIELEKERSSLQEKINELEFLLSARSHIEDYVFEDLKKISSQYATKRKTQLIDEKQITYSSKRKAPLELEIADTACSVLLSTSGLLLRCPHPPPSSKASARHSSIRSHVLSTTRGHLGALTSGGKIIQFSPIDLPAAEGSTISFSTAVSIYDYFSSLPVDETIICLVALDSELSLAIGTQRGIIKRVLTPRLPATPEYDVITLEENDKIVGGVLASENADAVFITAQTHLCRFPLSLVRVTGRKASGVTGIKLDTETSVIFFGALEPDCFNQARVVTLSHEANMLISDAGRIKITHFSDFAVKGRAIQGMRSHRLLKHETELKLAWVGVDPVALLHNGNVHSLNQEIKKITDSGTILEHTLESIGSAYNAQH